MFIKKQRILNAATYLSNISDNSTFKVVALIDTKTAENAARKMGFSLPLRAGDTILPATTGPVSRYNAEGKWDIHKDQEKESRYIRTVSWTWKQWAGRGTYEEHTEYRDIYRDCYPRTLIEPPAVELSVVQNGQQIFISSPSLTNSEQNLEINRHVINLLLEAFSFCELVSAELQRFTPVTVQHLNWRFLPPGEYPWERLYDHIRSTTRRIADSTRGVIIHRQEVIRRHQPDTLYVGQGGFDDYIAYVFRERGLVVLESIRKGNAIYVFDQGWTRFVHLTKAEIIANGFHRYRIVHSSGWEQRLALILRGKRPSGPASEPSPDINTGSGGGLATAS